MKQPKPKRTKKSDQIRPAKTRKALPKSASYVIGRRPRSSTLKEDQAAYFGRPYGPFQFLEFFAGGGMARAGLAPHWTSVWANDFSESKAAIYRRNWGGDELHVGDVAQVHAATLPSVQMAWGSFPCQDLSQAGQRSGIGSEYDESYTRSGSFWPFWKLVVAKRPPLVVLENVEGALKANNGADLRALCSALSKANYQFGPMVLDAVHWIPQSRRRLFIVAVDKQLPIPSHLLAEAPNPLYHPASVIETYKDQTDEIRDHWLWWSLPFVNTPRPRVESLISLNGDQWVTWDSPEKTKYILSLMNEKHAAKVTAAQMLNRRIVGFAYRRTRDKRQRAEVRFDGIAGCLRTAGGGSSKQIVVEVHGPKVRTRLLSPREAARLQGLPDTYWLPDDYNEAYDLVGDGLSVPAVRFLGEKLLTPLAAAIPHQFKAIA